ncbi:hypothetical protein DFQ00_1047 [Paenibacillus barcinonensis]|uniref:Uncharacterized protein n=1 Tax=Paenibacillus barcinonensis TaxID=198119 RepID=A0A2V4VXF5_PAEBA|nr:hypothetical protein DFQ00_1047 [Paenibacillus barcinonensis]
MGNPDNHEMYQELVLDKEWDQYKSKTQKKRHG